MRIALGLACLTLTALLAAQALGLVPDADSAVREGRKALCESVAVPCSLAAQREDLPTLRTIISALVARNRAIDSAAVRHANGRVLVEAGAHGSKWQTDIAASDHRQQVEVPIYQGKRRWGTVEIRFAAAEAGFMPDWWSSPMLRLIIFVSAAGMLIYTAYLKRILTHLDPSSVIPDRVRTTLDALAEGVLLLDKQQRIVMANAAFAKNVGRSAKELQGIRATEMQWSVPHAQDRPESFPWDCAIEQGISQTGVLLGMQSNSEGSRTFVVNTVPILAGDGKQRGALATFDDVTSIEQKNLQLEEMLDTLRTSRDEIHRQNRELNLLARQDPLTGCLNRRSFFTEFETAWNAAAVRGELLSCVMVDIDHFKSINDTHGHSTGDQVLQQFAETLRAGDATR